MFPAKHILIIENPQNSNYARILGSQLQADNFIVYYPPDEFTALAQVKQLPIHAALINVRLVNERDANDWSGIELAERISPYTRVVMMAQHPSFEMTRMALARRIDGSTAASDLVAKNEGLGAVIAALHNALHLPMEVPQAYNNIAVQVPRPSLTQRKNEQWHPRSTKRFALDHHTRSVIVDGTSVSLTEREYRLVLYFLDNAETVITREDIVCQVLNEHYDPYADTNRVNNIISRLRRRLEPAPEEPQFIITRWGSGWMFYPHGDASQMS